MGIRVSEIHIVAGAPKDKARAAAEWLAIRGDLPACS